MFITWAFQQLGLLLIVVYGAMVQLYKSEVPQKKKLYKSDNNTVLITLNGAVCKSKNLNCVFPMLKGTVQCLARNPKRGKE